MTSRRRVLIGGGAAVIAARTATLLGATAETPVNFTVPSGACDSHTHVIADPKQFPFSSSRTYTPNPAPVAESRAMHRRLGIDRIIVVQPSFYGTDNSATLDGVRQLGRNSRAIVVIDERTSEAQLDAMHRAGARGIRLNFSTFRQTDPAITRREFRASVERLVPRKAWHIQVFTNLAIIGVLEPEIMAAPMPIVIDHFGSALASKGVNQPGFDVMVRLLRAGKIYVKVSGPYRISKVPGYTDVAPLAKAYIGANPQRILWGSDWPHPYGAPLPGHSATDLAPNLPIDNGLLLNLLAVWAPDAGVRKTILVDNPNGLFDF